LTTDGVECFEDAALMTTTELLCLLSAIKTQWITKHSTQFKPK